MSDSKPGFGQSPQFATTRWSMVVEAAQQPSPKSDRALESLCKVYWLPLYAYVCRRVADSNEAQDLTQAFFAELLEKNYLAVASPERGKFRAFLLTSFKHFLSRQRDHNHAQKRGGGQLPISLDFQSADSNVRIDPAAGLTPEQIFDRQWTIALLGQIMQRLKAEFVQDGKSDLFEALKGFMIGDRAGTTYAITGAQLGLTEAAARQAASRMRRRYRELLREEIAQTVSGPGAVEEEIRDLFQNFQA